MSKEIIIGSRGSDLALWQANFVQAELEKFGYTSSIKIIKTQGDLIQNLSFEKLEGKGFFTKEIEEQLLNGEIDVAVHSHKDLETNPPAGLTIAAVSHREDPRDLLLINKDAIDDNENLCLKKNAVIGTSSARRKNLIKNLRPDITLKDLRGNVPTRIEKLKTDGFDAIILAAAGVTRLEIDLSDIAVLELDPTIYVPAPAQGVLGLQIRESDEFMTEALSHLNEEEVAERIFVERKVLNLFEGGCQLPLGVYCEKEEDTFKVWASMSEKWEETPVTGYYESKNYKELPEQIVADLKKKSQVASL